MKSMVSRVRRNLVLCFLSLSIGVISHLSGFSQGVSVNTTGVPPDPSAILDASSDSQGILVPRMTEAQKTAITAPATGLMIYQTNGTNKGFWYYNGTVWVQAIGPAGATGATGPAGPAGASAGGNPVTHVSAPAATSLSWLNCYNYCFNLSDVPASPADGNPYSDWRMPSVAEAFYYKNTLTAPAAGWLCSSLSCYVWTTDQHITDGSNNGWYTMNESGSWNGNSTNTSLRCRCVR